VSGGAGYRRPVRVRRTHLDWLCDRLSDRDWTIVETVQKCRAVTGAQLQRACFADLAGRSQAVVRWRVLKRLTDWRVLTPLDSRIGGPAHGSAPAVYTLDTAGHALIQAREGNQDGRPRRPSVPGERFLRHTLAISELYVQFTEATHDHNVQLDTFICEPACWLPDGLGGWLKPDAFTVLSAGHISDDWFIEVDLATEHIPTLRRKLQTYLNFHARGQLGPHSIMPRVLICVPDTNRRDAVQAALDRLPHPPQKLLHVTTADTAVTYAIQILRQ
jgi:Replication-relaxation